MYSIVGVIYRLHLSLNCIAGTINYKFKNMKNIYVFVFFIFVKVGLINILFKTINFLPLNFMRDKTKLCFVKKD